MEQQDKVQGIDVTTLSICEESVPYEFNEDGRYTCEGVEGSFMSIDTLYRAWKAATIKKKLQEAKHDIRVAKSKSERNIAVKEFSKWQKQSK